MSGSGGSKRRRRVGSTARRYKAPELVPIKQKRQGPIGAGGIMACIGVVLVTGALIALVWSIALRTIADQTQQTRDRVEQDILARAVVMAEEIRTEMLSIDQSLTILRAAWNQAPDTFKLTEFQQFLPALTTLSPDIFVADEKWVVRQSIIPSAVGARVGGGYVNFQPGALESFGSDGTKAGDGRLLLGEASQGVEARRALVYLVQPLDKPANWKVGAAYRTEGFTRLFAGAALGINGMSTLIDLQRGIVQAVAGPGARKPSAEVLETDMFTAFKGRGERGAWTGPTAMDGVVRIHAFSKIPGREMVVAVGMAEGEALAPAIGIAANIRAVAMGASAVLTGIAGLVIWVLVTFRTARRRQRAAARAQADLEAIQSEVASLRIKASLTGAQVQAMLQSSPDGVALLDHDLHLIGWNQRFSAGCGIPVEDLREGMPIDALMREQARAGLYGVLGDGEDEALEIEVARRVAILRTEPSGASLPLYGPEGVPLAFHIGLVPDGGGLVLILAGLDDVLPPIIYAPPPPPPPPTDTAAPVYTSIEW